MATRQQFLDVVLGEVGYLDSRYTGGPQPPNEQSKYADEENSAGPWCLSFENWADHQVGLPGIPTQYVPTEETLARAVHRWRDGLTGIQPGDRIIWDWPGSGDDHTSTFLELIPDQGWGDMVKGVDGNTSGTDAGNGGSVQITYRTASLAHGYWVPPYEDSIRMGFSDLTGKPLTLTPQPEDDDMAVTTVLYEGRGTLHQFNEHGGPADPANPAFKAVPYAHVWVNVTCLGALTDVELRTKSRDGKEQLHSETVGRTLGFLETHTWDLADVPREPGALVEVEAVGGVRDANLLVTVTGSPIV